jgi:hypothetical protein
MNTNQQFSQGTLHLYGLLRQQALGGRTLDLNLDVLRSCNLTLSSILVLHLVELVQAGYIRYHAGSIPSIEFLS